MNILFFLTPKSEVETAFEDESIRDTIDAFEHHHYTTVPIINRRTGHYVGTICEGDLLRHIGDKDLGVLAVEEERNVMTVKRKRDYAPVTIDATIQELFEVAMQQNFVPVVDDTDTFIGIVTRNSILGYLIKQYHKQQESNDVHTAQ